MSNKERAVESLYYRLEALADQFVKASGDEAVAIAKKINVYGRTKEILEDQNAIEENNANKPAQEAPKPVNTFGNPEPWTVRYGNDAGEPINW